MKVIIMRGIPGSCKSSLAKSIPGVNLIISADDYHLEADGTYNFDPKNLARAHNDCLTRYTKELLGVWHYGAKFDNIIVDNTNIKAWEIAPYYRLAEAFGFQVEIGHIVCHPDVAAARCVHGVPHKKIIEMMNGIEPLPPWWNVRYIHSP